MKNTPVHFTPLLGIVLLLPGCEQKQSGADALQANEPITYEVSPSGSSPTPGEPTKPGGYTLQFQDILTKLNAQCPQRYPEVVTPIPDEHELAAMDSKELIGMLESWNPVLRVNVAQALGTRGTAEMGELRKGTHSANGKVRAGSATALTAICKNLPPEELPTGLDADYIRLSTDTEHEVRVAALQGLSVLNPKTGETTLAVLAMCIDPNEYLAENAKMALDKHFEAHKLPITDIEAGLKAAMGGPLPRGRGHIVTIISKLKPADQRRFIPELLAHLDWHADRDTMFAGGGQELALKLLTKMEVAELVPRLPKLMGKSGRGHHLYAPSIESARKLGAMSKPIYDELKKIYKDMEKLGKNAPITPDSRSDFKEGMNDLKRLILELEGY